MAIRACLAKISPLDPATGNRVDVYLSSVNDRIMAPVVNGLGGFTWTPALKAAPLLTIQLWNGDFQAAVDPGSAQLALKMEAIKRTIPAADTYFWIGAPVEIYAEAPGVAWPWTARFKGTVESLARQAQDLALTASVGSSEHDKDVLTASYAGTGGAEGGADLKNKLKPLVLGWAKNVEPVLIDTVNNVHQFSGYGAIEGVTTLFERGSAFSAAVGDYATYAALIAATIAPGRWGTCLAQGMIRLGAPAYGVITADLKGHKVGSTTPRLTGAVINALATIAGVSSGVINTASLTAMDTAAPYSINLVLRDQASWLETAQRLALACNYQAGLSLVGSFFVAGVALSGTEVVTLDAQGKALPQVTNSDEQDVSVPYYKTIMGASRSWRVHTADEIAFNSTLIDKGAYDAATTYREGFFVSTADGSQWLYTNPTPTAGNAPPTWPTASNTWWSAMSGPLGAEPATGNRVPFSQMEGGVAPWTIGSITAGISSPVLLSGTFQGTPYIKFTGTASAAGQQASIKSASFPVTAFEYLAVSAGLETTSTCTGQLAVWWVNSSGSTISTTNLPLASAATAYNTKFQQIVQAPSGAVTCWIEFYIAATSASSFFGSMTQPSVTPASAAQTAFPAFSAGPNAYDGATVGAPVGTFVGGLPAADVANTIKPGGGVAVNQVITSSITNASVNAVSNAYSSGAASFPATTYTTIQSISLTTSGGVGAVVALKAALNLSINDQAFLAVALRITRDGTAIYDAAVPQTYTDVAAIPARVFFCSYLGTVSFSDTPGAGAHTYELQIYSSVATGSPTNPQVTNRYLEAIEIKK